jgi:hypothetical protein
MAEMQKIIDAENSDLFDVLAHVAYALPPLTREERATRAKVAIGNRFTTKQQVFLGFVLSQYVKVGVEELDRAKLSPLLKLKYNNAISDAWADRKRSGSFSPASKSTSTSKGCNANVGEMRRPSDRACRRSRRAAFSRETARAAHAIPRPHPPDPARRPGAVRRPRATHGAQFIEQYNERPRVLRPR